MKYYSLLKRAVSYIILCLVQTLIASNDFMVSNKRQKNSHKNVQIIAFLPNSEIDSLKNNNSMLFDVQEIQTKTM